MTTATHDIVDTATNAGSFKTLLAAAEAADLVSTLKGTGPFTVFAPTDDAFRKLPTGTVDNLLRPENKAKLVAMLKHHVVSGKVTAADIGTSKLQRRSVAGTDISIDGSKGVTADGAKVTTADVMATNGVIHIIDTVMTAKAK
jgi:uncharacterized surface protein with fasciclin (FAS1) repeats